MNTLLQQIEKDRATSNLANAPLVFLGDYVDRGEHSAQVLEQVFTLQTQSPDDVICIQGNHEKMMLDFLADPIDRGARWLRFGGVNTLESYGITGVREDSDADTIIEASDALETALPDGLHAWMQDLPLLWKSGNVVCAHAALDPGRPVDRQPREVLLWGHGAFFEAPRDDEHWVVHGHTIMKDAITNGGRISLDTGAYKTGRLTAAAISDEGCRFLQA